MTERMAVSKFVSVEGPVSVRVPFILSQLPIIPNASLKANTSSEPT